MSLPQHKHRKTRQLLLPQQKHFKLGSFLCHKETLQYRQFYSFSFLILEIIGNSPLSYIYTCSKDFIYVMDMISFMAMWVLFYFCVTRSKMIGFADTRELLELWCDSDGQMYKIHEMWTCTVWVVCCMVEIAL